MLRLIAVFDGRPGHEKQTKGILKGLQEHTSVKIVQIDTSTYNFYQKLLQWFQVLLPFLLPRSKALMSADLIIGTGSKTHSTILKLKRRYRIPACTCMTPYFLYRGMFDYCFVPEHDLTPPSRNIVNTIGSPNCNRDRGRHLGSEGLILLGGIDTSSHHWDNDNVIEMVKTIVSREADITWTITSSPRTPMETNEAIKKLLALHDNVTFFPYEETWKGWVEEQYDRCELVWVTSDSISMLYEAMSAGCKVHILPMRWKKTNSKFKRNEDILIQSGRVQSYDSWLEFKANDSCSASFNEAQRCADMILRTWWPESLQ